MSSQLARRFDMSWRRIGLLLIVALAVLLVFWLLLLRPWPLQEARTSFESRLDTGVLTLGDYRDRIEAAMRLQFLESALVDGRRSTELRLDYRVVEDQIESVLARMEPAERSALESTLDGLPADLSRDRSAALRRLVEIRELLLPNIGLTRQGDTE